MLGVIYTHTGVQARNIRYHISNLRPTGGLEAPKALLDFKFSNVAMCTSHANAPNVGIVDRSPFPSSSDLLSDEAPLWKKARKTPKPSQRIISPGKSSNVATGSSGSQAHQDDAVGGGLNCHCMVDCPNLTAEADNGSTYASSRTAIQDKASESLVSSLGVDGAGSRHELASELFSSPRLRPILMQISGSLRNRRDGQYRSWRERLGRTIERYVSI